MFNQILPLKQCNSTGKSAESALQCDDRNGEETASRDLIVSENGVCHVRILFLSETS